MKIPILLFAFLFVTSSNAICQSESTIYQKQIGISGFPIIYLNGARGNPSGLNGVAIFGSYEIGDEKNGIGLKPFYGTVNSSPTNQISAFGGSLFYRKYFALGNFKAIIDGSVGLGYIWYKSRLENPNPNPNPNWNSLNGTLFTYAIGPGLEYKISQKIKLEFLVQYLRMRNVDHPSQTTIGNTLVPSIGIRTYLSKISET